MCISLSLSLYIYIHIYTYDLHATTHQVFTLSVLPLSFSSLILALTRLCVRFLLLLFFLLHRHGRLSAVRKLQ